MRLALTPPFDVAAALGGLAAHAVPGAERTDLAAASHTRTVPAPHGTALVIVHLAETHAEATLDLAHPDDEAAVLAAVRFWLDLDADPAAVAEHLRTDLALAPLVGARPGLRVLGHVDGFEAAASTVLGQQVSLAAGRTFVGRLVAAYGTAAPGGFAAFPRPERLAAATPEELQRAVRITGARSRTLQALAAACADGLTIGPGGDLDRTRQKLRALPGIGPWTVDYLSLRALGDRDAFPSGDLVLRRALGGVDAAAAVALAERWRPWRAYAVTHLWTRASYL
ncbi:DNA-3-methyladenine glycosylase [Georgenia sp. SYP-B2076]|uniref:DNA-3-methyladenine glycosylase family protein n=1 Tax=Georgenia sp. SYP-B2076 TaxID=2495881 RepID=UPI000F8EA914|nr:AlkA N-terminal domain-containing protein [Georgenia sp. SYP-B2076]